MANRKRRIRKLDRIYEQLDDVVPLLVDYSDVQDLIHHWMYRVDQLPATSLLDAVQQTLTEYQTEYEMYRVGRDGRENFPDECADCTHYPDACPLLTYRHYQQELKKLTDELVGEPQEEVRHRLERLAGDVGCIVIPRVIGEWDDTASDLLAEGLQLRRLTNHLAYSEDPADRVEQKLDEMAAEATAIPTTAATDGGQSDTSSTGSDATGEPASGPQGGDGGD